MYSEDFGSRSRNDEGCFQNILPSSSDAFFNQLYNIAAFSATNNRFQKAGGPASGAISKCCVMWSGYRPGGRGSPPTRDLLPLLRWRPKDTKTRLLHNRGAQYDIFASINILWLVKEHTGSVFHSHEFASCSYRPGGRGSPPTRDLLPVVRWRPEDSEIQLILRSVVQKYRCGVNTSL